MCSSTRCIRAVYSVWLAFLVIASNSHFVHATPLPASEVSSQRLPGPLRYFSLSSRPLRRTIFL